jgi:hypothetical protein
VSSHNEGCVAIPLDLMRLDGVPATRTCAWRWAAFSDVICEADLRLIFPICLFDKTNKFLKRGITSLASDRIGHLPYRVAQLAIDLSNKEVRGFSRS